MSICVQHLCELAYVPCPLFAWTRKLQKTESKMRICVQVDYYVKWFQRTGSGRLREGKQRGWESQSKAVSSSWSLLWAVLSSLLEFSVELSRMCLRVVHLKGGKGGPYLAVLTTFVLLAWLMLQNGYVAMGSSWAGAEKSRGRRDIFMHELVATVIGWSKNAGKEEVGRGTRGVWYFLLPECSLLLLKLQSNAIIKSIFHALENISRDLMGFVQA